MQGGYVMEHWKKIVPGLVVLAAGVLYLTQAHAAAPAVQTQGPGFYRMTLGDFEVTALNDGTLALPVKQLLTNTSPERIDQMLKRAFLSDPVITSVNAYVINTGSKLVMVDAGTGVLFGPTLGKLLDNLKAAGYQPEQIDEIYITHMHGDHVGGLMSGDKLAFPNAIVRADKREADFWLSEANMNAAPKDAQDFFKGAMLSVNPYATAGKFKTFDGATELVPGVRAVPSYGHTKGHTIYYVESKGQTMVVLGDLMHVASVQFPNPAVTIQFDTDPKMAAAARKKAFADVSKGGFWMAVAHLSFPGIGHIRQEGAGYVFYPVNYVMPQK
jgi:glyoxylase-like metal-dependent hydrolase (beta-lactamase superfamily II)